MSAIAGLFRFDEQTVHRDEVGHMIDALTHRGPDARGLWCEGSVGFAYRSLHTAHELRHDDEPLASARSPHVLVADARIDNWRELCSQLGIHASRSRPSSARLILAAYERWGSACAEKLCGDFAFALWDPTTRSVFSARDAMGVRPLYYAYSRRRFAFASEIKGLLALDDVSRELDPEMVALFVDGDVEDRERTLYRDIRRLPAGHTLRADSRTYAQTSYWRLDSIAEVRYASDDDYADAFRELFREAVACRLPSDRPLAAALSGGLDSSSIVCMARQLRGREESLNSSSMAPLHTFSLVFPSLPANDLRVIDERGYIAAVVNGGEITAHDVRGDQLTPMAELRSIGEADEPFAAPNLYLHRGLYEAASGRQARVFLDGFDGDSAVSHGLGRLESLARSGNWDLFESEVRSFALHRGIVPSTVLSHYGLPQLADLARAGQWSTWRRAAGELSRRFSLSRRTIGVDYGLRPLVPTQLSTHWQALRGRTTGSLLRPNLARHIAERRAKGRRQAAGAALSEREAHIEGVCQALYQSTLELADRTAASFGLEPRYPFFDRRLIEFCVAVPDEQKFANGWSRYHFRRAMTGILPDEIQWRSGKGNLSPNFFRGFRVTDRALVDQVPFEVLEPYVDVRSLDALRRRDAAASPTSASADALVLYRLSMLATWLSKRSNGVGTSLRSPVTLVVANRSAPLAHRAAASAVATTSNQE